MRVVGGGGDEREVRGSGLEAFELERVGKCANIKACNGTKQKEKMVKTVRTSSAIGYRDLCWEEEEGEKLDTYELLFR